MIWIYTFRHSISIASQEYLGRKPKPNICDICKKPIRNLPDIESLPPPDLVEPLTPSMEPDTSFHGESVPPALDLSFDFLRITWIATIVCVLLVQLDLQESLWVGSICGVTYVLVTKVAQWVSGRVRSHREVHLLNQSDAGEFQFFSPPARTTSYTQATWYSVVAPPV